MWNSHIKSAIERATRAMWACRRLYGRTWGLNPKNDTLDVYNDGEVYYHVRGHHLVAETS